MTSERDRLIRELLRLYVNYGPDTFTEATDALRKGAVSSILASAANQVSRVAKSGGENRLSDTEREGRGKPKATAKEGVQKYIMDLQASGREGAHSIAKFVDDLARRSVLASPRVLREYLSVLGLPMPPSHLDRHSTAKKIGDYLLTIAPQEAEDRIRIAHVMSQENSTLQAWTDIIVKKESKS